MTIPLSSRLSAVKPSITLAVTAKAKQLRASGVDVVGFGAGEPDFDTPEHIKEAARKALDGDAVAKYTPVLGIVELRKAVAEELGRAHGVESRSELEPLGVGQVEAGEGHPELHPRRRLAADLVLTGRVQQQEGNRDQQGPPHGLSRAPEGLVKDGQSAGN